MTQIRKTRSPITPAETSTAFTVGVGGRISVDAAGFRFMVVEITQANSNPNGSKFFGYSPTDQQLLAGTWLSQAIPVYYVNNTNGRIEEIPLGGSFGESMLSETGFYILPLITRFVEIINGGGGLSQNMAGRYRLTNTDIPVNFNRLRVTEGGASTPLRNSPVTFPPFREFANTTALGNGQVFATGAKFPANGGRVTAVVVAPQAGTARYEVSQDGVTWFIAKSIPMPAAGIGVKFDELCEAPVFRFSFLNGATPANPRIFTAIYP